jgi:hypothetical protein
MVVEVNDDGFDAAATNRLIQGEIIKFADGRWSTKEGLVLPGDLPLLAVGTTRALQRWEARMPVDTMLEKPGEPLPDVDDLNASIPESEWELGLDGKPKPPWGLQHVVYLLNTHDAASYTYLNSTTGARIAVERLAEKVGRMRMLRGAKVLPVVTLGSAQMKTKYGTKARPDFIIVDWRDFGPTTPALPSPSTTPALGSPVAPVSLAEELNDSIPI